MAFKKQKIKINFKNITTNIKNVITDLKNYFIKEEINDEQIFNKANITNKNIICFDKKQNKKSAKNQSNNDNKIENHSTQLYKNYYYKEILVKLISELPIIEQYTFATTLLENITEKVNNFPTKKYIDFLKSLTDKN